VNTAHPSLVTLADYLAALLPAGELEAVRCHLSECAECAEAARSLQQVPAILTEAASPAEPMPAAVWDRLTDALRAESQARTPPPLHQDEPAHRPRIWPSRTRPLLAAAVTVAVVGAAGAAWHQLSSSGQAGNLDSNTAGSSTRVLDQESHLGAAQRSRTAAGAGTPTKANPPTAPPKVQLSAGRPHPLSRQNVSSYATHVTSASKQGSFGLHVKAAAACAQPKLATGSAIVAVRRWEGGPAVVVVNPADHRVSVLDCRTASILLYTTRY
jgi:hypothetical protein